MLTPSAAPISFEIRRVVVSVPLPAANGSTSVMLRFGYGACAEAADASANSKDVAAAMRRYRFKDAIIGSFLPVGFFEGLAGKLACPGRKRKAVQHGREVAAARFHFRAEPRRDAITTPASTSA